LLDRLKQMPEQTRTAVIGAGSLGDPVAVPWLIEQMAIPALARAAGQAFCMISGADLSHNDLAAEPPEVEITVAKPEENSDRAEKAEGGESEQPEAEKTPEEETDPDENLHWPDPRLVQKWWDRNKGGFAPGVRHLAGKAISKESLEEILRQGKQPERAAAALELALRQPEQGLFEVRAPARRQQQLLQLSK
jgi:uncharacterized protein (TIGR02270 family)